MDKMIKTYEPDRMDKWERIRIEKEKEQYLKIIYEFQKIRKDIKENPPKDADEINDVLIKILSAVLNPIEEKLKRQIPFTISWGYSNPTIATKEGKLEKLKSKIGRFL